MNDFTSYYRKYIASKKMYLDLKKSKNGIIHKINIINHSATKQFAFASMGLTEDDNAAIQSLKMKEYDTFNYCGMLASPQLHQLITDFVVQIGNDKDISSKIADILIDKVARPFLAAFNSDALWLTIRASGPFTGTYTHRWHRDGFYYRDREFADKNLYQVKLAGALCGPGTTFIKASDDIRDKFLELYSRLYKNIDRTSREAHLHNQKIIEQALEYEVEYQPKNGEVALFVVGNKERAAIHSEPDMNSDRFFFSIVHGSKSDIMEWAQDHDDKFIE
jgi:hypothetical protein